MNSRTNISRLRLDLYEDMSPPQGGGTFKRARSNIILDNVFKLLPKPRGDCSSAAMQYEVHRPNGHSRSILSTLRMVSDG